MNKLKTPNKSIDRILLAASPLLKPLIFMLAGEKNMSYFMVINGNKPNLNDIAAIKVFPLHEDQEYIVETIHRNFPEFDDKNTYSISDQSDTMDLIPDMQEQVNLGENFNSTLFGQIIIRCMNVGCKIFVWWSDTVDYGNINKYLERTSKQEDMIKCILRQQNKDGNVCALYEPQKNG